jgi:hypothetical protein
MVRSTGKSPENSKGERIMGRKKGSLSAEQKTAMQEARKVTREQRTAALEAIGSNPQFTHPKTWERVDSDTVNAVAKAIEKSRNAAKKAEIARLEKELAALRGE